MIGKLIALLGAIAIICWQSSQIHKWHENATHCGEARAADRTSYEQAQKTAEALNKAQVERVKSQQQRITDDVEANLSARLERLRRELSQGNYRPSKSSRKPRSRQRRHNLPRPFFSAPAVSFDRRAFASRRERRAARPANQLGARPVSGGSEQVGGRAIQNR
jgi:anti-sigma28 factor (negative regulator of flagellin synthesis)